MEYYSLVHISLLHFCVVLVACIDSNGVRLTTPSTQILIVKYSQRASIFSVIVQFIITPQNIEDFIDDRNRIPINLWSRLPPRRCLGWACGRSIGRQDHGWRERSTARSQNLRADVYLGCHLWVESVESKVVVLSLRFTKLWPENSQRRKTKKLEDNQYPWLDDSAWLVILLPSRAVLCESIGEFCWRLESSVIESNVAVL